MELKTLKEISYRTCEGKDDIDDEIRFEAKELIELLECKDFSRLVKELPDELMVRHMKPEEAIGHALSIAKGLRYFLNIEEK